MLSDYRDLSSQTDPTDPRSTQFLLEEGNIILEMLSTSSAY